MDPITAIAAASAAIELVERLVPLISGMVQKGEVTKEQQEALASRINSLRIRSGGEFKAPHWTPSDESK